jgi:hypothetical protein
MNDMMQRCAEWMMSFGWAGMLLGIVLLAALAVLAVWLIAGVWRAASRK